MADKLIAEAAEESVTRSYANAKTVNIAQEICTVRCLLSEVHSKLRNLDNLYEFVNSSGGVMPVSLDRVVPDELNSFPTMVDSEFLKLRGKLAKKVNPLDSLTGILKTIVQLNKAIESTNGKLVKLKNRTSLSSTDTPEGMTANTMIGKLTDAVVVLENRKRIMLDTFYQVRNKTIDALARLTSATTRQMDDPDYVRDTSLKYGGDRLSETLYALDKDATKFKTK